MFLEDATGETARSVRTGYPAKLAGRPIGCALRRLSRECSLIVTGKVVEDAMRRTYGGPPKGVYVLEGAKGIPDDAFGDGEGEAYIRLRDLEVPESWTGRVLDSVEMAVGEEDCAKAVAMIGAREAAVLGGDNVADVVEVCCWGAGLCTDLEGDGGGEDAVEGLKGYEAAAGCAVKEGEGQVSLRRLLELRRRTP